MSQKTDIEQLYMDYFTPVFRYLIRLTNDQNLSEELTQQTFFRAMQSADSFRGDADVKTWLIRIAKNLYLEYLRKRKHRSDSTPDREIPDESPPLWEKAADDESRMQIHRILHTMKEPYKEVFSLRVFSELSFAQIGEIFGKSEGWARVTYLRAKRKIQEAMT